MKASSQFLFISQRLINNLKIKVLLQRNVTIELKFTFLSSSSARKIKIEMRSYLRVTDVCGFSDCIRKRK